MIKKLILTVALSMSALTAAHAECRITSVMDRDTRQFFNQYSGWSMSQEQFDVLCTKLNRANARIQVTGQASVLGNQSIGWAALSVRDRNTAIGTSDFASTSTFTNSYASQDKANELMALAINDAAEKWKDLDKALAELEKERARARTK